MAQNFTWDAGTLGDWSDAADWQGGTIASGTTANVTIAGAGSGPTISTSYTINSLTLGSGSPFLQVDGYLDFAGASNALILNSGTLEVGGGTLAGAKIQQDGGTLTLNNATLEGVSYAGTLNVDLGGGVYNNLSIENGITSSGGVINLNGADTGNNLTFLDSEICDNQTIDVDNASGGQNIIYAQNGAVTFGTHAVIDQSSASAGNAVLIGSFVNEGKIIADGSEFDINSDPFTNASTGTISVGGTTTLFFDSVTTLENDGLISVASGGILNLAPTSLTNNGKISLANGSALEIQSSIALNQLGSILTSGGAVIDVTGELDLGGGTLDVKPGTEFADVQVNYGTLANGVLKQDGGTLSLLDATADAISYSGTLNVDLGGGQSNYLYIQNGITDSGGFINLNGADFGNDIYFDDGEVFDNQTIDIDNRLGANNYIYAQNGEVTFGAHAVIEQSSSSAGYAYLEGSFVNEGKIIADGPQFDIQSNLFTNASTGTISVGGKTSLDITNTPTFENDGLISVASGGTLNLAPTAFTNTGTVSVASGGTLDLGMSSFVDTGLISVATGSTIEVQGDVTLSELESIKTSGSVLIDVTGVLDLGGGTLDVKPGTEFANVLVSSGTLANGVIKPDGGALTLNSATLDGVSYSGTLNIDLGGGAYNYLYIENGITSSGGEINLNGADYANDLTFNDGEVFDNQTLDVDNGYGGNNVIYAQNYDVTFGAHAVIEQSSSSVGDSDLFGSFVNEGKIIADGPIFYIQESSFTNTSTGTIAVGGTASLEVSPATFENDGLISVAGGTLDMGPVTFTNNGEISVTNFGTAIVNPSNIGDNTVFTNMPGNTLIGGTYDVESGGTLVLPNSVIDNAADIILSGAGSTLESSGGAAIELSLNSIASSGTLQILGGRGYATTNTITDAGKLILNGGTFAPAGLSISSGGSLAGNGTVAVAITDNGRIEAAGQTLTLDGNLSGTGGLLIDPASELILGAGDAAATNITFGGSLAVLGLAAPGSVLGTLVSLAPSETIDLVGKLANAATITGGHLVASLTAGGTLSYALASPNALDRAVTATDHNGGTDVVIFRDAQPAISPDPKSFGQQHVGASLTQSFTVTNSDAADGYSENLDATIGTVSGAVSAAGSVSGIVAGGHNSTALTATLSSATAGVASGTAAVNLYTDGNGVAGDGLGSLAIAGQAVTLSGTLFNYATASAVAPNPVSFGEHHAGDAISQILTISNSAAPGIYSEKLDATFSGTSADLTASGSITTLAAGSSNSAALAVTLHSGTAGALTGNTTLGLTSDGSGIDTLASTALSAETVAVTGTLYNYATASALAPNPVNLGQGHVTDTLSKQLTIANTAAPGIYSEKLDAGFSGTSADLTASGSVTTLAAGSSNSIALGVTLHNGTAGAFSGATTLGLNSDGAGIDTLASTALTAETVAVTGTLFNYATASAVAPNPVGFGEHHVGDAISQILTISNIAATGIYSEKLDAGFSGTSADLTASGSVATLTAGSSNSAALAVTLHSGTAGAFTGNTTLGLTSDGSGIDTLASTALTAETVAVTGTLYNYATASAVAPDPLNFGIVHIGQSVSQFLTIANTAAPGIYSEGLDASFSGTSSDLTALGSVTTLAAGASNSAALNISLATGAAGIFTGSTTLGLTSDGAGIDTLASTALTAETVTVTGTVNNYATAAIENIAGAGSLTGSGSEYMLNFGYITQGSSAVSDNIGIENSAAGPADLLSGSFGINGSSAFTNSSFSSFNGIAAGSADVAPVITLDAANTGVFSETIVLDAAGANASGYSGALASETLVITGDIENSATITAGSTLELVVGNNGYNSLSFSGSGGKLIIDGSIMPSATISGFGYGDSIKLANIPYDSATDSVTVGTAGIVTITAGGAAYDLNIAGAAVGESDFTISGDLLLTRNAACFAAGTRILMADGTLRCVEDLCEGDQAEIFSGEAEPIIWIGHRTLDISHHPRPETVQPVVISAGSLGRGIPWRDLIVSPDHAIYLDGHLIPAKVLTNGYTIYQLNRPSVTYYHVELRQHSVLFAEGAPAESYLETGNRSAFENGGGAITLYPDFAQTMREVKGCAPFSESGAVVEAVRQRILDCAGIETETDPDMTISYQNGEALIASRGAVPGELTADPRDQRKLGVKIASINIDGAEVPLDHPALVQGWHDAEPDGRWTNGSAVIPESLLQGSRAVRVTIAGHLPYPVKCHSFRQSGRRA